MFDSILHRLTTLTLVGMCAICSVSMAQVSNPLSAQALIAGRWVINDELSENTDERVEAAIREAGGRVRRRGWFTKREEDQYRGGPPEQELYDRISYDDVITIAYDDPEFVFVYADEYRRVFHTDGRRRTTGVNDFFESGGEDFSFGHWDENILRVEARPRDGGYILETYTLEEGGQRLRIELTLEPLTFGAAITLTRIFDRAN